MARRPAAAVVQLWAPWPTRNPPFTGRSRRCSRNWSTPGGEAFVLNPGDVGLVRQLESIDAAAASARPMPGRTTVAAHVRGYLFRPHTTGGHPCCPVAAGVRRRETYWSNDV